MKTTKADQRKRRKAGFEVFSPTVFKPKFVAWLEWEGLIDPGADRAEITRATEDHLRSHYALPDVEPVRKRPSAIWEEIAALRDRPQFAVGSFGEEFTALRDRSSPYIAVGMIEREGWHGRPQPVSCIITRRNAVLRHACDLPEPEDYLHTPGAVFEEDAARQSFKLDHYDIEENIEEASADLSDEVIEQAFDDEGFEVD